MKQPLFIITGNSDLSKKTMEFWIKEAKKGKIPEKDIKKAIKVSKSMQKSKITDYYVDLGTIIEKKITERLNKLNETFLMVPRNP